MERRKKTLQGRVVSNKTDKTISVLVESYRKHPLYGKRVKYSKKYATHDENNTAHLGDLVRIEECRPMSKTKKFTLVEIVEKAVTI
ncbi:MAG: 30S ribosomal protein S17 [Defluviitaleaceae bacterium]|nr:30S ribosomal protein S17 [Defluviitaleaceae bacterium]